MNEVPSCRVVRAAREQDGKQGLRFADGVSAETAGSRGLCLHAAVIPPGGRAHAHLHENHESAVYVVAGEGEVWSGADLAHHETVSAGDFIYIPAGAPHLPGNRSATEPLVIVVARTDPNEQESVVLLPELDAAPDARRAEVR